MKEFLKVLFFITMMFRLVGVSVVPVAVFADGGESESLTVYSEVADTDHVAVYEAAGQYIEGLGTPGVGSIGGEWMVICLTRSGRDCPNGYYENVVDYVNENINEKEQLHRSKSTDNSRVILALTSAGYDVTDVDGHNLLKGLSDMSYIKKQGVNGPIWALIALDSYDYDIPENENEETQATREDIISCILDKQLSDGGWSIFGNVADPDMTGMALQSLAPYYDTNSDVSDAVERALNCLSEIQNENGSFGSVDGVCSESCAQVVVALTTLGIDPEKDERFVKNGISVVDALCSFAVEEGGFEHVPYGGINGMATEQSQYALVSYFRFLEGQTTLYDMTDVEIFIDEEDGFFEDYETPDDFEIFEDYEEDTSVDEFDIVENEEHNEEVEVEESVIEENEIEESVIEEIAIEESVIEETEKIIFTEDTFEDVNNNDWYYDSVKYVYENNLMQGIGSGFDPESNMTRAMLVTVLYRMGNRGDMEYTHSFSDVPDGEWYSDAVAWASANGIVSGVSATEFAPSDDVTREQMALIIYRYAKMCGIDTDGASELENFADADNISEWALDAIKWAYSAGLVSGTGDGALSPKNTATRAQIATILMRFCENIDG